MFLGWPPIITLNNIYVAVNIYIYKLVTPEFICLLEWGVSVHQGLTDSFSFTFPSFFHIPWLTVNSLCLLFLMLLTLWTPYLCFHGLPLQINFFKWKYEVVVNLTSAFRLKNVPNPCPTHTHHVKTDLTWVLKTLTMSALFFFLAMQGTHFTSGFLSPSTTDIWGPIIFVVRSFLSIEDV